MNLLDLFRWVPTPTYGKCGGAAKDCSLRAPRDKMDILFEEHDQNLYQADQLPEPERSETRYESDIMLGKNLRAMTKEDVQNLSLYGKIYRYFAMLVFKSK